MGVLKTEKHFKAVEIPYTWSFYTLTPKFYLIVHLIVKTPILYTFRLSCNPNFEYQNSKISHPTSKIFTKYSTFFDNDFLIKNLQKSYLKFNYFQHYFFAHSPLTYPTYSYPTSSTTITHHYTIQIKFKYNHQISIFNHYPITFTLTR